MCVIAYQKTKQADLTYAEVSDMANHNPHGFGMMWTDGNKTYYKKGYFDVGVFYKDYIKLKHNPKIKEIALHFRIATGSNIDIANCHPFPITQNKNRIKSAEGRADVCIMMNGIIGTSTKEFSDTALYVMNNLKPYYDDDRRWWLHMSRQRQILFDNEIYGNRFVFMSKEGSRLFGQGWSDYEGKAQVSNRYWIPKKAVYDYATWKNKERDDYYNHCLMEWEAQQKSKRFASSGGRHKSYIDILEEGIVD